MTHDKTTFRDLMSKPYDSLAEFNLEMSVALTTGCGYAPFTTSSNLKWYLQSVLHFSHLITSQAELNLHPAKRFEQNKHLYLRSALNL